MPVFTDRPWCQDARGELAGLQVGWKCREQFNSTGTYDIILFNSHAGVEFRSVQARFNCESVAVFKDVVPVRVQMGRFMREKAEAVS